MFWIVGGEGIIHALAAASGLSLFAWMSGQLEHSAWDGVTFYDLIFPLFLFLAGVSFPFSMSHKSGLSLNRAQLHLVILRRALMLVLFGCIYNGLLKFDWENMRYASVLARIGLAWMFAAYIFLNTNMQSRLIWLVGILLGYWGLLQLVPAPGYGAGDFSMEGSLVGYVDRLLLPGRLYNGVHDPEGILSILPAVSTALLGMYAGQLLKGELCPGHSGINRFKLLMGAGVALIAMGYLWGIVFPVNKNLWTSSFVLVAGGWSAILLGLFYLVIDVLEYRRWAFPMIVIGLNSITIYMLQTVFIDFGYITHSLFGGLQGYLPAEAQQIFEATGYFLVVWLFLYFLYRNRIFLKV